MRLDRLLYLIAIAAFACTSCNPASDLPPEDATPEFAEVGYESGTAHGAAFAVLSASLTTDNGVLLTGFMFRPDAVHLRFHGADLDSDCSFSTRVDTPAGRTEYCLYA